MKRYESYSWGIESDKDGSYIKFTDHQAEIAKRDELLMECANIWFVGLGNHTPAEQKLYERVKKLIAQKDSTE